MAETNDLIFDYIKDTYDRVVAERESLMTRFQRIFVVAGTLLTAHALSLNVMLKYFEYSQTDSAWAQAKWPVYAMGASLVFLFIALVLVPGVIGTVGIKIPGIQKDPILKAVDVEHTPEREREFLKKIAENYMKCVEPDLKVISSARCRLWWVTFFLRLGVISTVVLLGLIIYNMYTIDLVKLK